MAKMHGARQQKRAARQKAKRAEKRFYQFQSSTIDPAVRLQGVEHWPAIGAYAGSALWANGIGHLAIARQETESRIAVGVFLVDVYCLGVKDAFWKSGSHADLDRLIARLGETQNVIAIAPACLVKIVKGAVEYAQSFGFPAHPDYRHAARLLEGIDPSLCPKDFSFGRDGKPLYIQGPNESPARAKAIMERVREAGGHFLVRVSGAEYDSPLPDDHDEADELA